jgi:hypothetical protein
MQFLAKPMLQDFYNKVIIPLCYLWNPSMGKLQCYVTLFDRIEKMHARAAKIIYGLHWTT